MLKTQSPRLLQVFGAIGCFFAIKLKLNFDVFHKMRTKVDQRERSDFNEYFRARKFSVSSLKTLSKHEVRNIFPNMF